MHNRLLEMDNQVAIYFQPIIDLICVITDCRDLTHDGWRRSEREIKKNSEKKEIDSSP